MAEEVRPLAPSWEAIVAVVAFPRSSLVAFPHRRTLRPPVR